MTDITELAQRARINAECGEHLSPAETMELVEALEKAQQQITHLEYRAVTVKLPKRHSMLLREDFNEDYHTEMAFKADEVQASLSAAGIKVEAE
ncbi:hypothetical protein [Klebsiella pneumoniae]|uniref:hypothetical protein n=1 Tax=Klebsiella pneumoniae TaxID=573 RepID=UPI002270E95F|nr:hypothetical protein [Klebsiella pneumoniae]MCY0519941.1 hypothetical protein [Klebsiella pneumoniae]